jgi:single-strand DNA-binding protein
MHKITLIGNLGSDPEQREAGWNQAAHFPVAVNECWTNSEGERQTRTIWYQATAWGKLGEACIEHLQKGRKVYIEGRLMPDNETGNPKVWLRDDGTPAAAYDLRIDSIEFLGNIPEREKDSTVSPTPNAAMKTEE